LLPLIYPCLWNCCLAINNSSLLGSVDMSHVPIAWQWPGWNIHISSDISAFWAECHISPCLYSSLYNQVKEGVGCRSWGHPRTSANVCCHYGWLDGWMNIWMYGSVLPLLFWMDHLGVTFTHSSYLIVCLSVTVGKCVNFVATDSVFIRCCGKFPHRKWNYTIQGKIVMPEHTHTHIHSLLYR
jgi:hypothetical protein